MKGERVQTWLIFAKEAACKVRKAINSQQTSTRHFASFGVTSGTAAVEAVEAACRPAKFALIRYGKRRYVSDYTLVCWD